MSGCKAESVLRAVVLQALCAGRSLAKISNFQQGPKSTVHESKEHGQSVCEKSRVAVHRGGGQRTKKR